MPDRREPHVPSADDLAAEASRLAGVAPLSIGAGSVWWLNDRLSPDRSKDRFMWITARMSHVLSVASLRGSDEAKNFAWAALAAIDGNFADDEYGGWYSSLNSDGVWPPHKAAYDHAFVLLAASSAVMAGGPGATSLLRRATHVVDTHFWDQELGVMREGWDAAWTQCEPYIGANANMHSVEAFIAVADATGNDLWIDRAVRIAQRFAAEAERFEWRLPEHYSPDLQPDLAYNIDQPTHQFRPPGATPGHGFEWARLLTTLWARDPDQQWALDAAQGFFKTAMADGWDTERGGLCYTTTFTGSPLVTSRFHWVHCEAALAGEMLVRATGDAQIRRDTDRIWAYTWGHFPDRSRGSWHHELDENGVVAAHTWTGKPDVYHAFQACLGPELLLDRSVAASFVGK